MNDLNYDENVMAVLYRRDTREQTIAALEEMKGVLKEDEQELLELTESTIRKLWDMSDEDFDAMDTELDR